MKCPFLSETRVRYCHASPVRKMIAVGSHRTTGERCSNSQHRTCELYAAQPAESDGESCPYLHETLAHYCGAASAQKFIPFSDQAGRCGTSGYRFCDLYMSFERAGTHGRGPRTGEIQVPEDLFYTPNHLWLHVGPSGVCHIGIDHFFASVLHSVESIAFVTPGGVDRPNAVLKVGGVDWPITFRNRMLITGAHLYLRSDPARLIDDPYGAGWLFEGCQLPDSPATQGLMPGRQALAWIQHERERLNDAVQEFTGVRAGSGPAVMNDGGAAVEGVLGQLGREETLRMLHAFFAPDRAWGEE